MSKTGSRPAKEIYSSYCTAAGVVLLVIGVVLSVADVGEVPGFLGLVLLVCGQALHPFWTPKQRPEPPPASATLADVGLAFVKGERYQAKAAVRVGVFVHWKPMGGFTHQGVLPAGTLVIADFDHAPEANFISVSPADRAAIELQLVPEEERSSGKYLGYSISIEPADFAAGFSRF